MNKYITFKKKERAVILCSLCEFLDNSMLRWLRDDALHRLSYPDKLEVMNIKEIFIKHSVHDPISAEVIYILFIVLSNLNDNKHLSPLEKFHLNKIYDEEEISQLSIIKGYLRSMTWGFDELGFHDTNMSLRYVYNKELKELQQSIIDFFKKLNQQLEPPQF